MEPSPYQAIDEPRKRGQASRPDPIFHARNLKRDRIAYRVLLLIAFLGSLGIGVSVATKPYTTLEDCAKFSGVVQSHSRSSEAIVKLDDGKKIYARSNQQTMNRRLATTRSNDRVSGYYLEATHNVVELYINGEKVAGFEKYQDYEKWERQFLAGCSVMLFICGIGFTTSYLRLPR